MLKQDLICRTRIDVDPESRETIARELVGDERRNYYFGENLGLMTFQSWFPSINMPGHQVNMKTYDFPVRLKFVPEPFDKVPYLESPMDSRGWNVVAWQRAALELQEQGVRAIVSGCGLTGAIQSLVQSVVDIPVYMSSMLFVPEFYHALPDGKRLAVLTIGENFLRAHDDILYRECGIDPQWPLVVQGIHESDYADQWATMGDENFDISAIEAAVVSIARQMVKRHPDIGMFLFECTALPPFAEAVRRATGLPVFDPVDMVKRVNAEVEEA
jgi:Asp/Glu/hydantoin racemase